MTAGQEIGIFNKVAFTLLCILQMAASATNATYGLVNGLTSSALLYIELIPIIIALCAVFLYDSDFPLSPLCASCSHYYRKRRTCCLFIPNTATQLMGMYSIFCALSLLLNITAILARTNTFSHSVQTNSIMEALIGAPSVTFSNNTIYANGTTVAGDPPEYQVADPLYHSLVYVFVESVEVFLQFIGFVVGMWVIRPLTRPGGPKYQGFK